MEKYSGVEKLFFELASETRLDILQELKNENLKMQEIARRLDLTATEVFRQPERLSNALLVQRKPDGTFTLAEYGKLVFQLSSSLEFVSKYREYFSTHDVTQLPIEFVNRLGEFWQTELIMDTVEALNKAQRAFMEAEEFGWGIAEGTIPERMGPVMDERIRKGVKLRFLIPENRFPGSAARAKSSSSNKERGSEGSPRPIRYSCSYRKGGSCLFSSSRRKSGLCGFFRKRSSIPQLG